MKLVGREARYTASHYQWQNGEEPEKVPEKCNCVDIKVFAQVPNTPVHRCERDGGCHHQ